MHSAPSVTYPVGRSRKARSIGLVLLALGGCVAVSFCLQQEGAWWRKAVIVLSWCAAMAAYRVQAAASNIVQAHWSGQSWTLKGPRDADLLQAAGVFVHLDLQFLMLAQFTGGSGASRWVWFDRAADPARWFAVRRALHMRVPQASRSGGIGTDAAAEARP